MRRLVPWLAALVVLLVVGFVLAAPQEQEANEPFSQPLSLEQCLELAAKRSPLLQAAARGVEAASYRLEATKAGYRARVTLQGSTSKTGGPALPGPDFTRYGLAANASYPLFTNGIKDARLSVSLLSLEQAQALYSQQLNQLTYNVKKAYYDLLRANADLEAARQRVRRTQAHYDQAQANYEAGISPLSDVLRAKADLQSAKSSLQSAVGSVQANQATLNQLLNIPIDTPLKLKAELPVPPALGKLAKYQQLASKHRPSLIRQRYQLEAAKQEIRASKREKGFQINLSLSQSLGDDTFPPSTDSREWSVSLQASYPLLDGGRIKANVKSAEAQALQEEANLVQASQQVALDVQLAYVQVQTAEAEITANEAYLASAKEALDSATGRYKAGVGNVVELVDAESAYYEAEIRLNQSRFALLSAWARLEWAIGTSLEAEGGKDGQ